VEIAKKLQELSLSMKQQPYNLDEVRTRITEIICKK